MLAEALQGVSEPINERGLAAEHIAVSKVLVLGFPPGQLQTDPDGFVDVIGRLPPIGVIPGPALGGHVSIVRVVHAVADAESPAVPGTQDEVRPTSHGSNGPVVD